jgi:hypothetical protein
LTSFDVTWGSNEGAATVTTVTELDEVLDSIPAAPGQLPYSVAIIIPDPVQPYPVTLEIGIGDPQRSFAFYVGGRDDAAWAYEPALPAGAGMLINYAGQATDLAPHQVRVTPAAARQAARLFVSSGGQRPTNLEWDDSDEE